MGVVALRGSVAIRGSPSSVHFADTWIVNLCPGKAWINGGPAPASVLCRGLGRLRLQAHAIDRNDPVLVLLVRPGRRVKEAHLGQRFFRRVMVGHRLKERFAEPAGWLLREPGKFLPVTLDDEPLEAALEVSRGVPGE